MSNYVFENKNQLNKIKKYRDINILILGATFKEIVEIFETQKYLI